MTKCFGCILFNCIGKGENFKLKIHESIACSVALKNNSFVSLCTFIHCEVRNKRNITLNTVLWDGQLPGGVFYIVQV